MGEIPPLLVYVALSRATSLNGLYITNREGDHKFYHAVWKVNSELRNEFSRLRYHKFETIGSISRGSQTVYEVLTQSTELRLQLETAKWLQSCEINSIPEDWPSFRDFVRRGFLKNLPDETLRRVWYKLRNTIDPSIETVELSSGDEVEFICTKVPIDTFNMPPVDFQSSIKQTKSSGGKEKINRKKQDRQRRREQIGTRNRKKRATKEELEEAEKIRRNLLAEKLIEMAMPEILKNKRKRSLDTEKKKKRKKKQDQRFSL